MSKGFSSYQKRLIKNYYENLDKIALARLSELVSKIYLAESESEKEILWKQAESALKKLKVPQKIAQHIIKSRSPEILAKNLTDWMK